jgi:hypothetical protein
MTAPATAAARVIVCAYCSRVSLHDWRTAWAACDYCRLPAELPPRDPTEVRRP